MIIKQVTITGADDNTSIEDLQNIQNKYQYVEWGILIASNPGRDRQPTEEYILNLKDKGLNLSLHICSQHTKDILTDGKLDIKYDFFDRYQLNFNFNHTKHDLNNYHNLTNKFKDKPFILQSNFSNEIFIDKIISNNKTTNTHILYDSSGGRGVEIKTIKSPYKNIYTGYSGGINIDNINDICKELTLHKNNDRIWIDMETGVRTNNKLDLDKVTKILKAVDKHRNKGFTL